MKFSHLVMMALVALNLYYLLYSVHSMRAFRILRSKTSEPPCHTNDGPMDRDLRCEDGSSQIILHSNQAKQKRNLIIFDIDLTLLEAIEDYHKAVPSELRKKMKKQSVNQLYDPSLDTHLLLIESETFKYSVAFRKNFFDFLRYIHDDIGFSADMVLYTRARPEYAKLIAIGITHCYKAKYQDYNISAPLFKMVISTSTPFTAKTIATLQSCVALEKYQNIIIVDDDGRKVWCKYEMIRLRLHHKVNVILVQCPEFTIWNKVHALFRQSSQSGRASAADPQMSQKFISLIAAKQKDDNFFFHFYSFLRLLHHNRTDVLPRFAIPIRDFNRFNRVTTLWWWDWFQIAKAKDKIL